MTQRDLADALGLSVVHVNRSLQSLRRAGLLAFQGGVVVVKRAADLRELAGFDDGYLGAGAARADATGGVVARASGASRGSVAAVNGF